MSLIESSRNGHINGNVNECNGTNALKIQTLTPDQISAIDNSIYEHQLGPDHIIATEDFRCWTRDGAIRLRSDAQTALIPSTAPINVSIPTVFKKTVEKHAGKLALTVERDGEWQEWTFQQYYDDVRTAAKAFVKLGLRRHNTVSILGFNSPEWVIGQMGAIFAGGLATGLYRTNSAECCGYMLADSQANIVLVEDEEQLTKILQVKDTLPQLKVIVQWLGKVTTPGVISWSELMNIGRVVPDEVLERRLKGISVNQPCLIFYTSGTTGDAKGALVNSETMLLSSWQTLVQTYKLTPMDRVVSYLPLNHAAAQTLDVFGGVLLGFALYFAKPDALKGSLLETIKVVKPTQFLAVPRVWEKMYAKFSDAEKDMSFAKKAIMSWAKSIGWKHSIMSSTGSDVKPMLYNLANSLVFRNVLDKLGLSETRNFVSSAAPLNPDIVRYFHCLDMFIVEGYGLTECAGLHTFMNDSDFRIGSVGKHMPWSDTKIHDPDSNGEGEILIRGRHTFMGYLNKEKDTTDAINGEGWVNAGDIGYIDNDGYLFITGRKKELLITSGGENIAPVPIENNIKRELDVVSYAMVVADKRNFLSALITVKTLLDDDGNPTDELAPQVQNWLRVRGCDVTTTLQLIENVSEGVKKSIDKVIDIANSKAISNAAKVRKWTFLPHDFSIGTGELGPTMKLRRQFVVEKYSDLINSLYTGNG